MTNRTNPEQTPDVAGPTNEEVEAARGALAKAHLPAETHKGYPTIQSEAVKAFCDEALQETAQ